MLFSYKDMAFSEIPIFQYCVAMATALARAPTTSKMANKQIMTAEDPSYQKIMVVENP